MYPVERSSPRLRLREPVTRDVDAMFAVYGSPEATEHLSFEPRTRDQVAQFVAEAVASTVDAPRTEYALAVVERGTGELIGSGPIALWAR
ncbi:GNAT family N-acetyltransferase [Streptomyces cyaneogriseus]|uniref:GNAT family N-acetyltransferase n=1 Tax=Streptomyces cyaneogriseus TaxID=68192 RepID=UPI00069B29F2|nr:GNAT family N-acetyltransferase [Streptomyces cyaneogriseus]